MAALEGLIEALRRLPGVGQKSAQRMAYHLLQHDREGASNLAHSLAEAVAEVRHCQRCISKPPWGPEYTSGGICDVLWGTSVAIAAIALRRAPSSDALMSELSPFWLPQ